MKSQYSLLLIFFFYICQAAFSQIDSLIVEKYYISDSNDATNTIGGSLESGSITYRIYFDLAPGSKLLKIFGNENHQMRVSSTEIVFNNTDRGRSIGKDIRANRLNQNTVALDSWITIGLASDSHFGVLKNEDTNGSIIGGSAHDPAGLLVNDDPDAGIPLISSDGLIPVTILPTGWQCRLNGSDLDYLQDTTIFGNLKQSKEFRTNDFILLNSGAGGITSTNRVLVAQITTKGELSFSLNVEIMESDGQVVMFVAENPLGEEKTSRYLTYPAPPPPPPNCGCKDTDYLEFRKEYDCHIQDSCKTLIVYGCTDTLACNFDPKANYNIASLCCYPGRCNNRNINEVCPDIKGNSFAVKIYPNPVADKLKIEILNGLDEEYQCAVYQASGTFISSENLGHVSEAQIKEIDVSCLQKGLYILRLFNKNKSSTFTFIKN